MKHQVSGSLARSIKKTGHRVSGKLVGKGIEARAASLLQEQKVAEAIQLLKPQIAQEPANHRLLHLYGLALYMLDNNQEALIHLNNAIRLKPDVAEYHHNIAGVYKRIGDFENACINYQLAIQLKPSYYEAYFNYAGTKKFKPDDPEVSGIEKLNKNKELSDIDRSFLGFAGGKIFNDLKQFDKSFEYYAMGSRAMKKHFSMDEFRKVTTAIMNTFSAKFIKSKEGKGHKSTLPVFIVGMPRSGTSLVEQILSSHKDVYGAGELLDIGNIANTMLQRIHPAHHYPYGFQQVPDDFYAGYAGAYLQRLHSMNPAAARIIDKLPHNFFRLGLIAIMFPKAAIIHCKRDAMDTCLSCYFNRFVDGHAYSYDLKTLGLYYLEYERLMEHWNKVLPGRIYNLDYADLVHNPEKISREMIEFCGLQWDEHCLDFHNNPRPVKTASSWQVRQPINASGLGRWKEYDKHLGPLKQALKFNQRYGLNNT